MQIPIDQISPDALDNLIREVVTRDGTDYGEKETPLDVKMKRVHDQLRRGDALLMFDAETESCSLVLKR